ncbi:S-adenosyl-L-methionine-dependent methyltransferase [Microstroma glucosiphilum]|uniref:S-adenosyl-L-methionine-dependent methyltransferase n=1 Tax=Pseudomicrostroma glucosiphilum TaxID=1684307 RepID=A0A316UEZ3_9BASI|nr:S-adenosyl-L-methionine-dependent methyltransferase [Pseudomicrostroma glucosiphilum]PWN23877.1 S-adenosyl-L-methionine-dependent methyltransferase [Pseudomicrostroma glucosiphilum]
MVTMAPTAPKRSDPTPATLGGKADRHGGSEHVGSSSTAREDFDAEKWELENVHDVYNSIASHFSATRYKPWPLVTNFLASLPPGSIGIDVGCGNGKYLHLRNLLHGPSSGDGPGQEDCMTIGVDRSSELLEFARTQSLQKMSSTNGKGKGKQIEIAREDEETAPATRKPVNEVAVGDALSTGFRSRSFDYAISIATIHHLSTRQRRKESISELIRLIRPASVGEHTDSGGRGRFLVYVWALEQKGQERRKFDEQDRERRGGEGSVEGSEAAAPAAKEGRDVLVPWVLKTPPTDQTNSIGNVVAGSKDEQVYQRYYHLFEATELESLVDEAIADLSESVRTQVGGPPIQIQKEDSGWERGNWWGIWKVLLTE